MNFYLVPLERTCNRRAPRYLRSRVTPDGRAGFWSLKDFGNDVEIGLVATTAALRAADVLTLDAWTSKQRDALGAYLQRAGVESRWVLNANDWRAALHRLAGMTQAYQAHSGFGDIAANGDPSKWLGREIIFGVTKLGALDMQAYWREWWANARRVIPPLRVRQSFHSRPVANDWRFQNLDYVRFALPATDTFTGTTGTQLTAYSSSWTLNGGDFDIQSNALAPDAATPVDCAARWNADAFNANQYAQATALGFSDNNATHAMGVAVRVSTSGSTETYYGYYSDDYSTSGRYLFKDVAGTWTQIGSNNGTPFSSGDTVRLEGNSTTLTPIYGGATDSVIGAQTDSAIASGSAGISGWSDGADHRIDDWESGNLGGAAASLIFPSRAAFGALIQL